MNDSLIILRTRFRTTASPNFVGERYETFVVPFPSVQTILKCCRALDFPDGNNFPTSNFFSLGGSFIHSFILYWIDYLNPSYLYSLIDKRFLPFPLLRERMSLPLLHFILALKPEVLYFFLLCGFNMVRIGLASKKTIDCILTAVASFCQGKHHTKPVFLKFV